METPKKLIRYSVAVSPRFPSTHCRKGEPTYFVEAIQKALNLLVQMPDFLLIDIDPKLHTIRKNYPMWVKRMEKVNRGEAVIDLFYWKLAGGRYTKGNEPVVFATLDKNSGCGVQVLKMYKYVMDEVENYNTQIWNFDNVTRNEWPKSHYSIEKIASNDGLSLEDFKAWFKSYDLSEDFAIIHFTKFRY